MHLPGPETRPVPAFSSKVEGKKKAGRNRKILLVGDAAIAIKSRAQHFLPPLERDGFGVSYLLLLNLHILFISYSSWFVRLFCPCLPLLCIFSLSLKLPFKPLYRAKTFLSLFHPSIPPFTEAFSACLYSQPTSVSLFPLSRQIAHHEAQ